MSAKNRAGSGVEPFPAGHHLGPAAAGHGGNLGCRRRAADLGEARTGQVAQREVVFIHPAFRLPRYSGGTPGPEPGVAPGSHDEPQSGAGRHCWDPGTAPIWDRATRADTTPVG